MNIYACGDIHGQRNIFHKMLEDINFSSEDKLIIIGDIIDRGPDSIGLLQDIMKMDNVIPILGNHELFMYDFLHGNRNGRFWVDGNNGGNKTLSQYKEISKEEQKEIMDFIKSMYLQYQITVNKKKFLFSHSFFIEEQRTLKWYRNRNRYYIFDIVWDSPWRLWEYVSKSHYEDDGRIHVIGHVPVQYVDENETPEEAFIDDSRALINIDLGCARKRFEHDNTKGKALCCMNVTEYAETGSKDAFTYHTVEKQES